MASNSDSEAINSGAQSPVDGKITSAVLSKQEPISDDLDDDDEDVVKTRKRGDRTNGAHGVDVEDDLDQDDDDLFGDDSDGEEVKRYLRSCLLLRA